MIALLLLSGCRPPERTAAERSRLALAQVIDETDFLAQAAQVEGEALECLLAEVRTLDYIKLPTRALPVGKAVNEPERLRGRKVYLQGRLLAIERSPAVEALGAGVGAGAGAGLKGLVLMPDGGLAAFRAQFREGVDPAPPEPGAAVEVIGLFMKRWVALDGSGSRYAVIPLVVGKPPIAISGTARAGDLAGLEPAKGLLPLTEIEAPPVRSRPVVEVDAAGALRLDGRRLSLKKLVAGLAERAAGAAKTPLGDSALVAVVLADPAAPAAALDELRKALPVKAVFRTQSDK